MAMRVGARERTKRANQGPVCRDTAAKKMEKTTPLVRELPGV